MSVAELSDAKEADRGLLFEGSEWNFGLMQTAYDAVEKIALDDLGLNVFPNQDRGHFG